MARAHRRITPALLIAVVVLVAASGGVGYAAGKITSRQIQDGTIQSRDIKNGTITGADVARATVPRDRLSHGCARGEERAFGGCVRRAARGPAGHGAAIEDCNQRNGRLPTILELTWIASQSDFEWANGADNNYEFSGDYTSSAPFTPRAFDRFGNDFTDASNQNFWYHCITS